MRARLHEFRNARSFVSGIGVVDNQIGNAVVLFGALRSGSVPERIAQRSGIPPLPEQVRSFRGARWLKYGKSALSFHYTPFLLNLLMNELYGVPEAATAAN